MAKKLIKSTLSGVGSIGRSTKDPLLSSLGSFFEALTDKITSGPTRKKRTKRSNVLGSGTSISKVRSSSLKPKVATASEKIEVPNTYVESKLQSSVNAFFDMFASSMKKDKANTKKKDKANTNSSSNKSRSRKQYSDKQPSGALLLRLNRKVSRTNELLTQLNSNTVSGFKLLQKTMEDCCANSNGERMMELKNSIVNLTKKTAVSKRTGKPLAGAALTSVLERAEEKSKERGSEISSLLESLVSKVPSKLKTRAKEKKSKKLSESDIIEKINLLNREKYEKMFSVFFDRMKLGFDKTISAILSLNNIFLTKIDEIGKEIKDPILSMISKFIPFIFGTVKAAWKFIWGIPKTMFTIKEILKDNNKKISELTKAIRDENELIRESVKGTRTEKPTEKTVPLTLNKTEKDSGRGLSGIVDTVLNIATLRALGGRASTVTRGVGKILPVLGRLAPIVGGGVAAYSSYSEKGSAGKAAFTGGSAMGGALLGAKVGMAGGPVGIALGTVIGGIAGNFIGDKLSDNFTTIKESFLGMWRSVFNDSENILSKLASTLKDNMSNLVKSFKLMWNDMVSSLPMPETIKEKFSISIKPESEESIKNLNNLLEIKDEKLKLAILANIKKESGGKPIEEKLDYSKTENERIRSIFSSTRSVSDEDLNKLKKDREAFANLVYGPESPIGKSMGNEKAGDGWKYRGRGYIQITGKNNYEEIGKMLGEDLVNNPDLLLDPYIGAKATAAYIERNLKKKSFDTQAEANRVVTQMIAGPKLNLDAGYGKELLDKVNTISEELTLELNRNQNQKPQPTQVSTNVHTPNVNPLGPVVDGSFFNAESVIARNSPTPVLSMNPVIAPTTINNVGGGTGSQDSSFGSVASPRSVENTFEKATHDNYMLSLFRTHYA